MAAALAACVLAVNPVRVLFGPGPETMAASMAVAVAGLLVLLLLPRPRAAG